VSAILAMKLPDNAKDLQSFLGLVDCLKHGEKQDHKLMSCEQNINNAPNSPNFPKLTLQVPLCPHEFAILGARCTNLGNCFPIYFPNANLLRKFNVLTFHVPEKAILMGTVGVEVKHCLESIHPVVKFNRMYATT